jgi:hypothetical protein
MSDFILRKTGRGAAILLSLTLAAGCTQAPYTALTFPFLKSYKTQGEGAPRILDNLG